MELTMLDMHSTALLCAIMALGSVSPANAHAPSLAPKVPTQIVAIAETGAGEFVIRVLTSDQDAGAPQLPAIALGSHVRIDPSILKGATR